MLRVYIICLSFKFFFFFLLLNQRSACYGSTNSICTVWLWHAKMSQFLHGHLHQPYLLVKEIPFCRPQRQSYQLKWRISFESTPQHHSSLQYKPSFVKMKDPVPVAVVHHCSILEEEGISIYDLFLSIMFSMSRLLYISCY